MKWLRAVHVDTVDRAGYLVEHLVKSKARENFLFMRVFSHDSIMDRGRRRKYRSMLCEKWKVSYHLIWNTRPSGHSRDDRQREECRAKVERRKGDEMEESFHEFVNASKVALGKIIYLLYFTAILGLGLLSLNRPCTIG